MHILCPTVNLIALIYSRPRGFLACQPGGKRSCMPRSDGDDGIGRMHGCGSASPMGARKRLLPHVRSFTASSDLSLSLAKGSCAWGGEGGDADGENATGFHSHSIRAGAPRAPSCFAGARCLHTSQHLPSISQELFTPKFTPTNVFSFPGKILCVVAATKP